MYNNKVKVFAPVNIAWIKYMGKNNGIPTNSSLSLTLATLGTDTEMQLGNASDELIFTWDQSSSSTLRSGHQRPQLRALGISLAPFKAIYISHVN